jgi:hypothetical protein
MSINSGFTVTLPSNSCMSKHPTNAGARYTVTLASPLNFSGQTLNDDTRWEVSMLSLHYTHNFFNFRRQCKMYFVMDKPVDTAANARESLSDIVTAAITADMVEYVSGSALTHWVAERQIVTAPGSVVDSRTQNKELLGMIQLPKGYYPSVTSLCDDIIDKFDKLFFQRYKIKLIVTRKHNTFITFSLSNGGKLSMCTDESSIGTMLGLKCVQLSQDKVDARMEPNTVMYNLPTVGTEVPRLDNMHALYVYADVVQQQHVGDVMAPLIGYVNVNGKPGDRISHTCNPPIYLPVARSYIDAISVRITDENGQNVMFPDLFEHVVLRLHFRKSKGVSLF